MKMITTDFYSLLIINLKNFIKYHKIKVFVISKRVRADDAWFT